MDVDVEWRGFSFILTGVVALPFVEDTKHKPAVPTRKAENLPTRARINVATTACSSKVEADDLGRRAVEAFYQQPAFIIGRERGWAPHHRHLALAEPVGGRREQGARYRLVVHSLEEPEEADLVVVVTVVLSVLDGGDPPHHPAVPLRQEVLRIGMLEEGIFLLGEHRVHVHT